MPIAFLGVGTSGSGKTTALKPLSENKNCTYVCPDDIRLEISGNALDQTNNAEAWGIAYARIASGLKEGKSVVVDATNTRQSDRLALIGHCRRNGATIIVGILFTTSLSECFERNAKRDKRLPEYAIERMYDSIWHSAVDVKEGFDELVFWPS